MRLVITTSWLLSFLAIWLRLLSTVLYLPLLGTLTIIIDCEYTSSGLTHISDNTINCFKGRHLIHFIIGILFFIAFNVLTMLSSLLYHDMTMIAKENLSHLIFYFDFLFMVYKIGLVLMTIAHNWTNMTWFLAAYMLIFPGLLYFSYGFNRWFYTHVAQRMFACFALVNLWIGVFFTYISAFENTEFGGITIFLLQVLLLIIMYYNKHGDFWKHALNTERTYKDPKEIIRKVVTFIEVVNLDAKERAGYLGIMKGYIINHAHKCTSANCVLKKYSERLENINYTNREELVIEEMQELDMKVSVKSILAHCQEVFVDGILQFPNSNELRLAYSLYLIQVLDNKASALAELAMVGLSHPTFAEECLLYHCKEMVKESILFKNPDDTEEENITSVMAYKSHYNFFKEKIEMLAVLHNQFWNLLLDEAPDLTILRDTGFKIQNLNEELNLHWEQMQEINPDEPNAVRRYAHFLSEILNDKEAAINLHSRMNQFYVKNINNNKKRFQAANGCDISLISTEGDPCVLISGREERLGVITHCNIALGRLFDYTKKDLIGSNISCLIPEIIADTHSKMLRNRLENKSNGGMGKNEIHAFGKLRNGYIIPIWVSVLSQPTLLNESNYVAIIRVDKSSSDYDTIIFLLNTYKEIVEMSSEAILLFGSNNQLLITHQVNLEDLCPELKFDSEITKKLEVNTKLHIPKLDLSEIEEETKLGANNSKTIYEVNCYIEPLYISNYQLLGYSLKLNIITPPNSFFIKQIEPPTFNFVFDEFLNKYVRQYNVAPSMTCYTLSVCKSTKKHDVLVENTQVDGSSEDLSNKQLLKKVCESIKMYNGDYYKLINARLQQILSYFDSAYSIFLTEEFRYLLKKDHTDYETGIGTLRYNNGEFKSIKEIPEIDPLFNPNTRITKKSQFIKKKSNLHFNIKEKKSLEAILTHKENYKLTVLYILSYSTFIVAFSLAVLSQVILSSFFNSIKDRVKVIDASYQRRVYLGVLMFYVNQLVLVKM